MIALRDGLPLVRGADGHVHHFDRPWLTSALRRAAAAAGYPDWWLASHVTESVAAYFENEFSSPTVPAPLVEKAVRSVLEATGHADVARHFRTLPPPVRIELDELARSAGEGFELAFFNLLRSRLREAVAGGGEQIELSGLHHCVKRLRRAKNWRSDCSGLRGEIVSFVRDEIEARGHHNLHLQLS